MCAGLSNKSYIWVLVAALVLVDLKLAGVGREETNCSANTWRLQLGLAYSSVQNFTIFQVIGISMENRQYNVLLNQL